MFLQNLSVFPQDYLGHLDRKIDANFFVGGGLLRGNTRENKSNILLSSRGIVKSFSLQSVPEILLGHHMQEQPTVIQIWADGRNLKHPHTKTSDRWSTSDIFPNCSRFSDSCVYDFSCTALLTYFCEAVHVLFAVVSILTHEKDACICKCRYVDAVQLTRPFLCLSLF